MTKYSGVCGVCVQIPAAGPVPHVVLREEPAVASVLEAIFFLNKMFQCDPTRAASIKGLKRCCPQFFEFIHDQARCQTVMFLLVSFIIEISHVTCI